MYHIHDKVMHELSLNHIRTQVTVKLHDGEEDEQGERTAASDTRHDTRRYSVTAGLFIKVTLKNWSKIPLKMIPVYMSDKGDEEPEDEVEIGSGEERELPYPLQKEEGEEEDGWVLKDASGRTVLRLVFVLE